MTNFEDILGKDYKFLDENPLLKDNIHLLVYGGSKAYGTDLPTSDTDIRGIATNSAASIFTGKDFEVFTDAATDTVIYSLEKILTLLANCNPNTIEILFVRDKDIIYIDEIGQMLRANRDIFLSRKCIGTFGGYANQQLYRLQQKTVTALPEKEYNDHIAKVIKGMQEHLQDRYGINTIDIINTDDGLIADIKETRCPADKLADVLNEINNVIRSYNRVSTRNKKALEHNKINKHAMHLIRLYRMANELLTTGTVCTYRDKDHDLLMAIRNGEYSDSDKELKPEFFELVKAEEEKFNAAKNNPVVPKEPDYEKIDELHVRINELVFIEKLKKRWAKMV